MHKILYIDEKPEYLQAVAQQLEPDYEVECIANPLHGLQQFEKKNCDLLITALSMSQFDGIQLVTEFKKCFPVTPAIILTGSGSVTAAKTAILAGADEFLEKDSDPSELLTAVEQLLLAYSILKQLKSEYTLTRMQFVIFQHILSGKSATESAFCLQRSRRTLENHRFSLMQKMGASSAVEILTHPIVIEYLKTAQSIKEQI